MDDREPYYTAAATVQATYSKTGSIILCCGTVWMNNSEKKVPTDCAENLGVQLACPSTSNLHRAPFFRNPPAKSSLQ
jgi:hypothetical protein